jgi:hypothetical protein
MLRTFFSQSKARLHRGFLPASAIGRNGARTPSAAVTGIVHAKISGGISCVMPVTAAAKPM